MKKMTILLRNYLFNNFRMEYKIFFAFDLARVPEAIVQGSKLNKLFSVKSTPTFFNSPKNLLHLQLLLLRILLVRSHLQPFWKVNCFLKVQFIIFSWANDLFESLEETYFRFSYDSAFRKWTLFISDPQAADYIWHILISI